MKAIHLRECESTQIYLKRNLAQFLDGHDNHVIVSTSHQYKGIGRGHHVWDHYSHSLAFSFTLSPQTPITLTSHEIGILLVQFISEFFNKKMLLKWPNDLLNSEHNKCAGIIIHSHGEELSIVGIGMNLLEVPTDSISKDYKSPMGYILGNGEVSLLNKLVNVGTNIQECLPKLIYEYILANRLPPEDIDKIWSQNCAHLNRTVEIIDGNTIHKGTFLGIGSCGEALLQDLHENKTERVFSGSLYL